jgi:hypothetical protein
MNEYTPAPRIKVSRASLPAVIAKAYELSQPQGLGFLHAQPGGIPTDKLAEILARSDGASITFLKGVGLDYVQGRAVKLHIHYDEAEGHYVEDNGRWFDHSESQWQELKTFILEQQA